MKSIELRPEQFPLVIRLKLGNETKEYLLIKTRQNKLLLNKPNEGSPIPSK
jgi:hypothetical protein